MKVVKLDNRHRLYKEGFTHAFRFTSWSDEARKIERVLSNKLGSQYAHWPKWKSHWGKAVPMGGRPYWLGVREEKVITQVLLSA
jgi:hypothetical protein